MQLHTNILKERKSTHAVNLFTEKYNILKPHTIKNTKTMLHIRLSTQKISHL